MTIGIRADASGTFGVVDVGGVDVLKFGAGAAGDALEVAKKTDIPATYTQNQQAFTASGTFTVPAGVTAVYVSGIGGGGGAGGKNTSSYSTGGGGSGQYCIRKKFSVTPGQVISVTIGAGGSGGTISGTSGSSGGATTFGALLTLSGGSGSPGRTDTNTTPGIGGFPNGQTGGYNGASSIGGNGGCSPFGNGGLGVAGDGGSAAANTGGGGGGTGSTASKAGGAGGSGYLLVEW